MDSNIEDNIEEFTKQEEYSWIDNFNKREKEYDKYYKSTPEKITLFFLFIDKNNNVEYFLAKKIFLDNGVLTKNNIISLINSHKDKKKYFFYKLLKYNLTIDPENIDKLNKKTIDHQDFLTSEKGIQDIIVKDTIEMLHSINAIFLIYKEKKDLHKTANKTRRHHRNIICKRRKMPTNNKHT